MKVMKTKLLEKCLIDWDCKIQHMCNFTASQQKNILEEKKEGDITITLRGSNGTYFIEQYQGKTMYPNVYKVSYTEAETFTVTEEEYKNWLLTKN